MLSVARLKELDARLAHAEQTQSKGGFRKVDTQDLRAAIAQLLWLSDGMKARGDGL